MDSCDSEKSGQRTTTPPQDTHRTQDSKDVMSSSVVHNPKVESGVKKLPMDSPVNGQSPATNAASGRLVYVRRKVEVDTSKAIVSPAPKEPSLALVSSSTKSPVAGESSPQVGPNPRFDWEERYHHLQMLLNKLNESDQTDHVQMLWSLSSAELSKHAVELEKRSIQFSLEEAREMQRVAALNVLGRSVNSVKSTSNDGE